jgi:hypothetical protein
MKQHGFMSISLLILLTILPPLSSLAAEGDVLWTRTYGGTNYEWANAIIPAAGGNYLLAGMTTSYGHGSADAWLVKVNAQGDTLWTRTYGQGGWDEAYTVITTLDNNLFLAGTIDSAGGNLYGLKLNPQGDTLWTLVYGGGFLDEIYSAVPTSDGGCLLAGKTRSFGAANSDLWLVGLTTEDTLWSRTYGGGLNDCADAIISAGDDGFILAGKTGTANGDMWLLKVNADGDTLWTHNFGGNFNDYATAVTATPDGGFILAGWTDSYGFGFDDFWLVKVDALGDTVWARTYGGSHWEQATAITSAVGGGYFVVGWTDSFSPGNFDIWLLKIDDLGDPLWSRNYGGLGWESANAVTATSDGGCLLAGWTDSFGAGLYDMWLVRIAGPPTLTPVLPEPAARASMTYALNPSRPNPFNASTVASYDLRAASPVRLTIWDTSGRLVATLVDGWRDAGTHDVTFDASNLAAGVYLARLTAGDFTATQKMVLIK